MNLTPFSERPYIWSFVGQVAGKPTREAMLKEMKSLPWNNFIYLTKSWDDPRSLSAREMKGVYSSSIFVPCPRGNHSLDTFRVWEALEAGAIPLIEKDEGNYFQSLLGSNPLIEVPPSWVGVSKDLDSLLKERLLLKGLYQEIMEWWNTFKTSLQAEIEVRFSDPKTPPILPPAVLPGANLSSDDPSELSIKQEEFLKLADQWVNFKDYGFFNFMTHSLPAASVPDETFSCYNPGKEIAIVSLYTPEISSYARESEMNIKNYCEKQGYTFYVYRQSLDLQSHGNWSKPKAVLNHLKDHEAVVWMDSDTLVFNPSKKFEDILARCVPNKKVIACEDIGSQNKHISRGSLFNSGVVIFRAHTYTEKILRRWWDFRKENDTSSLYASGGDQEVLINLLRKSDPGLHNCKIFPMNAFNTDPRLVNRDTFILHFMAYPGALKQFFMKYWNS